MSVAQHEVAVREDVLDRSAMHEPARPAVAVPVPARLALASIAGFWAVWLALVTGRALVMGWPDQGGMLLRRLGIMLVGVGLAWTIYSGLQRMAPVRLPVRAAVAFLACAPAALLFATLNSYLFYRWLPVPSVLLDLARWEDGAVLRTAIADGFVTWYFFFAAWAAFLLALSVVGEVRTVERQRASAEAAAHDAKLAMLRLQVDPHFLFNALNALAAMVAEGETKAAGAMIRNLAAFFRAGLVENPVADISLADEVAFQRLYLAIEQARFGDRLSVEIDVPPSLHGIMLPPLVLQPLVENAINHGLGSTTAPVMICIRGRCEDGTLHLHVSDRASGPAAHRIVASLPSTGIGLANARARLTTRFGSGALLSAGAVEGGWDSIVSIPMAATHG
jgi:two-component system LytT family sensor kinase